MISDLSLANLTWKEWKLLIVRTTVITTIICSVYMVIYWLMLQIHVVNVEHPSANLITNRVESIRADLLNRFSALSLRRVDPIELKRWFQETAVRYEEGQSHQFYLVDHVGRIRAKIAEENQVKLTQSNPEFWFMLSGKSAGTILTDNDILVFRNLTLSQEQTWLIIGYAPLDDASIHHMFEDPIIVKLYILLLVVTIIISLLIARYQLIKQSLHEKIIESESMYKVFTENSLDWEEWLKPDGQYQYISPSCKKMTGYSNEELIENPELIFSLVHPQDQEAYRNHVASHVENKSDKKNDTLVFRIITKDNNLRWIQHNCHPITSVQGDSLGRYIVNRDITDEKLNQVRIKQSTELSYATLESSADHIAVLDNQGHILMVNNAWQAFAFDNDARCEKEDWIGIDYLTICTSAAPPSDEGAADVYNGLKSVINGDKDQFKYEYPCHSPTQERWFLLRAVPLQYHGGGVLISHTDITAMKLAERELHLAASSFQASDAIVITDKKTRIIRVNEAFTRITGYSQDEAVGQTPAMMKSGKHDKGFYASMWHKIRTDGLWEGEIWNRKKNGEIYPEHLKIQAVNNDLGDTVNYIAVFTDISRQKKAEETIHKLAFYDTLTGLPNKSLFMERLEQTVSRSCRDKKYSAALILDLDNFKLINDSLGHHVGDEILIEVADRIKHQLRQSDTAARLAGDEFALLFTELSDTLSHASDMASSLAERLLSIIKKAYWINKKKINLTASIGIDLFPTNNESAADIFTRADTAIHRAKELHSEVEFYQEGMQSDISNRLILQSQLKDAVKENQFVLYFQEIVNKDTIPLGAEALIRWNHPQKGVVSPGHFIDVAERSDLIIDIGHWVLNNACQHISHLQSDGHRSDKKTVAVNISAQQFAKDDFVTSVERIVSTSNIDASWLELEITESITMNNIESAIDKMNALKAYGIRWSIDDFGTGFSSLSYLKDLPFDTLKIDRSFVSNCHVNKQHQAIIKAIISMAHNLNLEVIAEGVESEKEAEFLQSNQCDYYQGFLYSKPAPVLSI
ncbi:MAG: EAL domain-containing protein [Candidatus Thiodiazotropha taylori]|nr:EAL domain-containing protein [Candidatus Thiodiazotropha taylori]